ncbi:UNVERIFIED_CONTAM: hypothetical protein LK11_09620 [Mumia flava]
MLAGLVLLAAVSLGACGSEDDEPTSQDAYCDAAADLRSSVDALTNLDLVGEGTNGLESAVDAVGEDVSTLKDTAGDAASDEVDALSDSIDDLKSAIGDAGDQLSSESVSAVSDAVSSVATSAQAVEDTLTDCP